MGCQESRSEAQREEDKENKRVESFLKKEKYNYLNEIKLLLLGTKISDDI